MKNTIVEKLKQLEVQHDITILFACETGSRAWGFPSNDSDYDVRFIYMHPQDWYLSIEEKRDTIEQMEGEPDLVGWDIRKALRLFRKSNAAMFEKLQSPIVYLQHTSFREELRALAPAYFSPRSGLHHYLSMSTNYLKQCTPAEQVKLKSYFYLLRTALASCWITAHQTVPPLRFQDLYAVLQADETIEKFNQLVVLKAQVDEKYLLRKDPALEQFAGNCLSHCDDLADEMLKVTGPAEPLNQLFRKTINATVRKEAITQFT